MDVGLSKSLLLILAIFTMTAERVSVFISRCSGCQATCKPNPLFHSSEPLFRNNREIRGCRRTPYFPFLSSPTRGVGVGGKCFASAVCIRHDDNFINYGRGSSPNLPESYWVNLVICSAVPKRVALSFFFDLEIYWSTVV